MTTVKEYIREGLLGQDHGDGVDRLMAFAPDVHFPDADDKTVESREEWKGDGWKEPSRQWRYWDDLLKCCEAAAEPYANETLPDDFGPREYLIFEKILRNGFNRWMVQRGAKWIRGRWEGARGKDWEVPAVFMYAVGELRRLAGKK